MPSWRKLWEDWKAQFKRCGEANKVYNDIEGKVFDATAPRWDFHGVVFGWPCHALFASTRNGEVKTLDVPLSKAKNLPAAEQQALAKKAEFDAERERSNRAAKRKHKWAAADRADKLATTQLSAIQDRITETPAEGLTGILVKLAIWRFWNGGEEGGNDHDLLLSTYEAAVSLTGGVDLAAQVERW
jgi:hypothetical protein